MPPMSTPAARVRVADAKLAHALHIRQHVWPGGHTGAYWHAHMAQYMRFYADACASGV